MIKSEYLSGSISTNFFLESWNSPGVWRRAGAESLSYLGEGRVGQGGRSHVPDMYPIPAGDPGTYQKSDIVISIRDISPSETSGFQDCRSVRGWKKIYTYPEPKLLSNYISRIYTVARVLTRQYVYGESRESGKLWHSRLCAQPVVSPQSTTDQPLIFQQVLEVGQDFPEI